MRQLKLKEKYITDGEDWDLGVGVTKFYTTGKIELRN